MAGKRREAWEQLELAAKTWGGRRPGAGRPAAAYRRTEAHRRRGEVRARWPVHVVMRPAVSASLRCKEVYEVWRAALERVRGRADFRVVHVSIQRTHVHLIVEADDGDALARGMNALTVMVARGLKRWMGGARGRVFVQRYHASTIATPRQARAAIVYVLNNWRRHGADRRSEAMLDRYASGVVFDGWVIPYAAPPGYDPLPVAAPTTWLLTTGWRRHGPIDPREVPARPHAGARPAG